MHVKLLRKLRKDAYKNYGIKGCYKTVDGGTLYLVGVRGFETTSDVASFSLEEAKKVLFSMRSDYCIKRVAELRVSQYVKI